MAPDDSDNPYDPPAEADPAEADLLPDDSPEETRPEADTGSARFRGRGFFDDVEPNSAQVVVGPSSIERERRSPTASGRLPPPLPDEEASSPAPDDASPDTSTPSRIGRGFYDDSLLLEQFQVKGSGVDAVDEDPDDAPPEMLLSDDMSRCYTIGAQLGEGAQGTVFEAEVVGEQVFPRFMHPVRSAVVKLAKDPEALLQEQAIYSVPDSRMVGLLDAGTTQEGARYIVLERLVPHPAQRFARYTGGKVDPATALDTFVNLLDALKTLHFRRELPLVICDLKPENIMLRMPTPDGELGDREYIDRLAQGTYEVVFTDLGCAQHREVLRKAGGRVDGLIGSPLYLPPESVPVLDEGAVRPGVYSPKTDVYGLCLSFYVQLTGDTPYHQHLRGIHGTEHLRQLLGLKRDRVSPIDAGKLDAVAGDAASDLHEVLERGLDPEPGRRATPALLIKRCAQLFGVENAHAPPGEDYYFDDPANGLPLRQTRFPRPSSAGNEYLPG